MRKMFFFSLVAAALFLMIPAQNVWAQSGSETPKIEVTGQYTFLHISDFGAGSVNNSGVGGRITYNFNDFLGVEGELNFFPQGQINIANLSNAITGNTDSHYTEGLFGPKIGMRGNKAGIFGVIKPGFVNFGAGSTVGGFASTEFALNYGGVLEFYPTRRVVFRVDVGDTLIHFSDVPGVSPFYQHNLQIGTGVGFRF